MDCYSSLDAVTIEINTTSTIQFSHIRQLAGLFYLVLAGIGGVLLWQNYLHNQPPPRLINDVYGKISLAVVSVNSARSSTIRNARLISNIVNALPAHSKILILAPDRSAFTVLSNPWQDRIEFIASAHRPSLTIWPQDPFLVLQKAGTTYLLVANEFKRADDIKMADSIANHLGWQVKKSQLLFEGGNIVADSEHIFIGANTIMQNAIKQDKTQINIAQQFQQELGKPIMVIGPLPQVIGHIDMMLTPLGNKHLLLADPQWGARLAREDLQHAADKVRRFERRSEKHFFGHPEITQFTDKDGKAIKPPTVIGSTKYAIKDSEAIAEPLHLLAKQLTRRGFKITRIPFLSRKLPAPQAETTHSRPGYPQLSYNNVLIETQNKIKTVYLPAYGWQTLDQAAKQVWRQLGYQVKTIPGFSTSAMYGGALRCSVKVLRRD